MASLLKAVRLNSGIFGRSKHKKLTEEWGDISKEPVLDGITFYVKYIGSTPVDEPSGHNRTAHAIKTIIAMTEARGRKLTRVALTVTPKGIVTTHIPSGDLHMDFSIYRISFCSVDATFDRILTFIATTADEVLELHAFLCAKRKIAQAAALTISQAFSIAFELWEQAQQERLAREALIQQCLDSSGSKSETSTAESSPDHSPPLLIDLTSSPHPTRTPATDTIRKLGFESDENLNDSFSRLAASRISHPLLGTWEPCQLEEAELREEVREQTLDDLLALKSV